MLVAGVVVLVTAQSVRADPLPTPSLPSLPSLPQVSTPALPAVPVPSSPQVPVPSLPPVSAPSLPSAPPGPPTPAVQLPSNPAATRTPAPTGAGIAAPRPGTGAQPRGAAGGIPATAGGSAPGRFSATLRSADPSPSGAAPVRRARRTAREPSSKRLRRLLRPLAGCVAALGPLQERVLVRRAGLRGFAPQTRRELARTLGTSRSRVARLERRGLRNLRRAIRAGGCATPASSAPTPGTSGTPATLVAEQVSIPASTGGGSPSGGGAVKGITESKPSSVVETAASAGRDALATISEPARSFADEHPLTFALVVLTTLLCGVLFVRELRRSL